jgi:fermentation-respiration switch protein FrsA (DUF1100 family)
MRRVVMPGLVALAALVVIVWLSHGAGDRFFYRPDATSHGTPASHGLDVLEVSFAAPGGPRLHGWLARAKGKSLGTVVYAHGNHANLTHHARFVAWLPARGYDLLLFDYRGYGKSEGTVSREGTVADTVAAIDFALARDPDRTFVFGHSLGGAVSIVAAARRPVRAIAVESTFPSYREAARATSRLLGWLAPWIVSSGLDPIDSVAALAPRPLLVIHGTDDRITPPWLGQALFAAARQPKELWTVEGGAHGSPWVRRGAEFEERLLAFFASAGKD